MTELVPYTVRIGMVECGVDDIVLFNGQTAAARLAEDLFDDNFETCLDKTHEEIDADFKTYSDLSQTQGQIRLLPGVKRNIKAFIQWVRDELRLGRDPSTGDFDSNNTPTLIRRYKTLMRVNQQNLVLILNGKTGRQVS